MNLSKTKIDKSGSVLAKNNAKDEVHFIEMEDIFDEYRKAHLKPLSETTLDIQRMLANYGVDYYIAQRLKRKPQIVRKLNRLSVRLTQLQDIGGCRIIVPENKDVDQICTYLQQRAAVENCFVVDRVTDYRGKGRDDTGYRSVHVILSRDGLSFELQIRSRIQHYWSESIERTSVIYGHHLKEKEGDPAVIGYFKHLSDVFYEIESGREPSVPQKIETDRLRQVCEKIILDSDKHKVFDSFVNVDVIKTLTEKESRNPSGLNNWILIFNWNEGAFVSWDIVGQNPSDAIAAYVHYEDMYPADQGFEVVLIGSSKVATVSKTHSHYFGIESYHSILENLDSSILGFSKKMDIDVGARQILSCLSRRHFWGKKTISDDTLKNHFCKNVMAFDVSLQTLFEKKLINRSALSGGVSLDVGKKALIEQYLR